MLLSCLLTLLVTASGTLATHLYFDERGRDVLMWRVAAGAVTGLTCFALFGFVVASLIGLTFAAIAIAAACASLPLWMLTQKRWRKRVGDDWRVSRVKHSKSAMRRVWRIGIWCLIVASVWTICRSVYYEDARGIYTGFETNIGDLPFHISIIEGFAKGENFPPEHTEFAGVPLTYPFMVDFVAACFMRLGADLSEALLIENFALMLAFAVLLKWWAGEFVCRKNEERKSNKKLNRRDAEDAEKAQRNTRDAVGFLTMAIVCLSGGLGWWLWWRVGFEQGFGELFSSLNNLPQNYSITPEEYRWGNAIIALLVPQRSLLMGMPIFLIVVTLWWRVLGSVEQNPKPHIKHLKFQIADSESDDSVFKYDARQMLAAGVTTGLLPLVHAHCFLVAVGAAACLAVLFPMWKMWTRYFAAMAILAAPQLAWAMSGSAIHTSDFIGWHFGWESGDANIFWFWLKNAGLFIPLIVLIVAASLMKLRETKETNDWGASSNQLLFSVPFLLLFVATNALKLSPYIWDNIKMIFCAFVVFAPLVALLLVQTWRRVHHLANVKRLILRGGIIIIILSLTLAGALDVWRVVSGAGEQQVFTNDGKSFAAFVEAQTAPRSLILHAPTYNHPLYLTGRRTLTGYAGHLWTHGLDYAARENDLKKIYANAPERTSLIQKYKVDYIAVGAEEYATLKVNESLFDDYEFVGETGGYRLYKVKK